MSKADEFTRTVICAVGEQQKKGVRLTVSDWGTVDDWWTESTPKACSGCALTLTVAELYPFKLFDLLRDDFADSERDTIVAALFGLNKKEVEYFRYGFDKELCDEWLIETEWEIAGACVRLEFNAQLEEMRRKASY